jgi:hypothetical protein
VMSTAVAWLVLLVVVTLPLVMLVLTWMLQ